MQKCYFYIYFGRENEETFKLSTFFLGKYLINKLSLGDHKTYFQRWKDVTATHYI